MSWVDNESCFVSSFCGGVLGATDSTGILGRPLFRLTSQSLNFPNLRLLQNLHMRDVYTGNIVV